LTVRAPGRTAGPPRRVARANDDLAKAEAGAPPPTSGPRNRCTMRSAGRAQFGRALQRKGQIGSVSSAVKGLDAEPEVTLASGHSVMRRSEVDTGDADLGRNRRRSPTRRRLTRSEMTQGFRGLRLNPSGSHLRLSILCTAQPTDEFMESGDRDTTTPADADRENRFTPQQLVDL
jgi:hypothetical protein